jgi:pimeloyl-ACP methyl ester carboxylesterase
MGTADPDFPDPASEAERTADALGGPAEVLMVDDAGHYPHAEHPEVVSPAVRAFLERTLPRTGRSAAHIVARS